MTPPGGGPAPAPLGAVSEPAWQRRGTKIDWKVSMPQDVAKKRGTEIRALNGLVSKEGALVGVATPMNDALTFGVERVERGEIVPSQVNLDALCCHV